MTEHPLTHGLAATFTALDDLVQRDMDARAHHQAQERIAFLHGRIQTLQHELRRLKIAALLAQTVAADTQPTLWSRTCAELKATAPADFRTPGRALLSGHLDLLQLVEYTAASIARVRERCARLIDELARQSAFAVTAPGDTHDAPDAATIYAYLNRMIDQLVSGGRTDNIPDAWRVIADVVLSETGDGERTAEAS